MFRSESKILQKIKQIFILILGLILFCSGNSIGQEKQYPNILFIAVDDLKPDMGCFGDSLAITPNIDALASKGMVFSKTYCQQAVCAPSRASLLTSQYPDQTEVWDLQTLIRDKNPDIVTLPQYFKQNGYSSYGVGKIFDYRSVENNDEISWNKYGNPYQNSLYNPSTGKPKYYYALQSAKDTIAILEAEAVKLGVNKQSYVQERYWPSVENADVPYDAYVDGAISKEGINLMNQLNSEGKPFFLAVGFQRPHLPFNAPKEFWDLYRREDFKLAEFQQQAQNSPSVAYHNFEELRSYTDIPDRGDISTEKQLELIHAYYASVSYIDFLVGKLTQRLEELNLADNTIIVLWGDHGWHLGDHNLWCKHSNFEEATHSPLIISYPGQPNAGKTYTHPAEFADIATTLCELTGLKVPLDFEGESLIPAFNHPKLKIKEGALSQYPRNQYMGYSLRTDRYRYTKWVAKSDGSHYASELYDYETDPLETINQAGVAEYADIKEQLDSIVQTRIKNPSTQEKIKYKIWGVNISGDTANVSNAEVIFDGNIKQTGTDGELLITHVPGDYNFSVESKGYQNFENQISVKNDTIVKVYLKQQFYSASIKVKGEWNNQEIENAIVTLEDQSKKTNANGNVIFNNIVYKNYNIQVELESGFKQQFIGTEIFSDTSLVLLINEPVFEVDVQVGNLYTNQSIYETEVIISDMSELTNSNGVATLSIPEGTHIIEIRHPKYYTITDTLFINSDTLFPYKLSPAFSTIKFKLSENTTPVNKATVTINNEQQISNSLGNAFFKEYPTFTEYSYQIEKEKYNTINGNLFLINDTTIDIQMVAIPTSMINPADNGEVKIWPNPVENYIHLQVPESFLNGIVQIFDITGNLVKSYQLDNTGNHKLSVKKLPLGTYVLNIVSAEKHINKVFLKKG